MHGTSRSIALTESDCWVMAVDMWRKFDAIMAYHILGPLQRVACAGLANAEAWTTIYTQGKFQVTPSGLTVIPSNVAAAPMKLGNCAAVYTLTAELGWGIKDANILLNVAARAGTSWFGWSVWAHA